MSVEMEMAALLVLRRAAELYNDAEILREAIECGDDGPFNKAYIEAEREVVADAVFKMRDSGDVLCELMGIDGEAKEEGPEDD